MRDFLLKQYSTLLDTQYNSVVMNEINRMASHEQTHAEVMEEHGFKPKFYLFNVGYPQEDNRNDMFLWSPCVI